MQEYPSFHNKNIKILKRGEQLSDKSESKNWHSNYHADTNNDNYTNNSRKFKHFWNGFDDNGKEKWFIEFENGQIISSKDKNYESFTKSY